MDNHNMHSDDTPKISVLLCTYNRSLLLSEAVESVLTQTYRDFELVVVNNGSTDGTAEVLEQYRNDKKLRVFNLGENRGWSGGYNYGLDQLRGEWFATLADDDVLMEDALETLIKVPDEVDATVNAVTANCLLKSTGELAGLGLDKDQYLDAETSITKCSGEFMGMTKMELLGKLRFSEEMSGNELWYQIDVQARRYYLHKPLKIFQDQGDTLSNLSKKKNVTLKAKMYKGLVKSVDYWEILREYHPKKYNDKCFKGWLFLTIHGDKENAAKYSQRLLANHPGIKFKYLYYALGIMGSKPLNVIYRLCPRKILSAL